jgi:RNA-binding protein Luc7-like 2
MKKVEEIRKKKASAEQEYRNAMPASSYQQQKLRVCEVCSAYLGIHDNDRRLADHFGGKLHLGFIKIREKLAELKTRVEERRKKRYADPPGEERDRQREREREREDRERERDRRRDRDRRDDVRRPRDRSRERSRDRSPRGSARRDERRRDDRRDRRPRSPPKDRDRHHGNRRRSRSNSKSHDSDAGVNPENY